MPLGAVVTAVFSLNILDRSGQMILAFIALDPVDPLEAFSTVFGFNTCNFRSADSFVYISASAHGSLCKSISLLV